jgi:hypothetical protein
MIRLCGERFALETVHHVPFPIIFFHQVMTFRVKK